MGPREKSWPEICQARVGPAGAGLDVPFNMIAKSLGLASRAQFATLNLYE